MSLEDVDNTPRLFIGQFIRTLAHVCPELSEAAADPIEPGDSGPLQPVHQPLTDALRRCESPWTLVIDDYQVVSDPEIHRFVARVIRSMPAAGRLVISTREEPDFPVARLRVQGRLEVIDAAAFRLSSAECAAMFHRQGVAVTEEQAEKVAKYSGGWTVAVHLAAIATRNVPVDEVLDQLRDGADRTLLSDYLLQEVLTQLPEDLYEFILEISILDRFTLETCHAVIGSDQTGYYFDRVKRSGLLVVESGDNREWFEIYELIKGMLRHELARIKSPAHIRQLHGAASRWFESEGFLDEAVAHAVLANDWDFASTTIILNASRMFVTNRSLQLADWLAAFPDPYVLGNPDLSSIRAYALIRMGRIDEAQPYIDAAEIAWKHADSSAGQTVVAVLHGAVARFREDAQGLIEHGSRAIQLAGVNFNPARLEDVSFSDESSQAKFAGTWAVVTPYDVPSHQFVAIAHVIPQLHIIYGLALSGRIRDAVRLGETRYRKDFAGGHRIAQIAISSGLGIAKTFAGCLVEADEILQPVAKFSIVDIPPEHASGIWARAQVLYEWDRLDEAERLLIQGIRMLDQSSSSTQNSPLYFELARIQRARGDIDGALESLEVAAASADQMQNQYRHRMIATLQARIALEQDEFQRAHRWVNAIEIPDDGEDLPGLIDEYLIVARLQIAGGNPERAAALLERLRPVAAARGAEYDVIRILTLLSLAYLNQFELDHAVDALHRALDRSEKNNFIRVYIDEGPAIVRLLRIVYRRGLHVPYITRLLEACGETPDQVTRIVHDEIVEPITARELDVLKLAALGLTNKQIADELFLAVATIKRHITNINGKLGVESRVDAVQQARSLGLLTLTNESDDYVFQSHAG